MPSQDKFSDALLDSELPVPAQLLQPDGSAAKERFGVYRNNVISGLVDAMVAGFPLTCTLLGEEYFRALAAAYVRQHPPRSPVIAFYGDLLPQFISDFEPLKNYPYLPDVSALELARRQCCNASDQACRAADQLARVDHDKLMQVVPVPHSSLQLLKSDWSIHEILSQHDSPSTKAKPDLSLGPQSVLLVRPEMQVQQYLLNDAQLCFLQAVDGQLSLATIATLVLEKFPQADFIEMMVLLIQRGAIAEFTVPKEAAL